MTDSELSRRIRIIRDAWCEWDPIGVFAMDPHWPRDEYDGYVEMTLHLLESGASEEQLVEYFSKVAHQTMGLSRPQTLPSFLAKKLLSLTSWPC